MEKLFATFSKKYLQKTRHRQDNCFLKDFLNGKYNTYFIKIFDLFGLEFNQDNRKDYLNIFFLVLYKRYISSSINSKENTFNIYLDFMKYVN